MSQVWFARLIRRSDVTAMDLISEIRRENCGARSLIFLFLDHLQIHTHAHSHAHAHPPHTHPPSRPPSISLPSLDVSLQENSAMNVLKVVMDVAGSFSAGTNDGEVCGRI